MEIRHVRLRTPTLKALRYNGSASHRSSIRKWVEGGEYAEPQISTRDLAPLYLVIDGKSITVLPGDWIVRDASGALNCFSKDDFNSLFEFKNGA